MMTSAAILAADYIASSDPALAQRFLRSRFQRITLAKAFAASVANDIGNHVVTLAEIDASMRLDPELWEEAA
jgi:hypothetical protein